MLTLHIPGIEQWDESKQEFVYTEDVTLELEHSLVSLSKWESKWEKAFLTSKKHTDEEALWYVVAMTLTPNVPSEVYQRLTSVEIEKINNYINSKMTATWFADSGVSKPKNNEVVTSELIYYWMNALTIPFECENWHLNRLFTYIEVCNKKNNPDKKPKMSKRDLINRNTALNEARRAQYGISG
jgi:hypothetical protein